MIADLHMHSIHSDGVLSPLQLAERARAAGVTLMALTDHDTFRGVETLRGADLPLRLIPGVELSLRDMHGLHLLGYGLGEGTPLHAAVAELAALRQQRARRMLERLTAMGMPLAWTDVTDGYAGTVGRAHVARAMVRKGYAADVAEAFARYLGEGRPAYVAGERLSMAQALALMRSSGFVPVLAHPRLLQVEHNALRTLLRHWTDQGLMGVEAVHPSARGYEEQLGRMARAMGLLVTGGSDYHCDGDSHGDVGYPAGYWPTMADDALALCDAVASARSEYADTLR